VKVNLKLFLESDDKPLIFNKISRISGEAAGLSLRPMG
jgi:hypothetical protein